MKKIPCPNCKGMGKELIQKGSKFSIKICKTCKGKKRIVQVKDTKKKIDTELGSIRKSDVRQTERGADMVIRKTKLTEDQMIAKEVIEERAAFFGCPGKVKEIRKGPVITLYEFAPAKTTRIKKLANLHEDLALALSAEAVLVRRIAGKDVIGIEISNDAADRQNVAFRASLQYVKEAKKNGMELPLNLGTDPFGEPVIDDLATMPHLLIAGSTGAGKSVSLNCIISSLLAVCSPKELQFFMIDPKGVELIHYNGIPHMREPMVTSPHYARHMMESLIREMRRRLSTLTSAGVRDLKELNKIREADGHEIMPRIILVVDELGDLMLQDRREFTRYFAEVSQIARATGIHMICATQRPSVDVLSGKVKVNFPGRMAFKVTSMADSKTIIHRKGAESLLGRGDMLYLSPTRSACIRIHAPWVPLEDVKLLASKIRQVEEVRRAEEERSRAERIAQQELDRIKNQGPPKVLNQGTKEDIDIDLSWSNDVTPPRVVENDDDDL